MQNNTALTKKLHILFVDDERLIREMVSDMLSDTVGCVSLASNGQEGLDFYLSSLRPIDVVISDQTMPIMQGLDMLEKIKQHNPAQKCIMITAHSENKYMLKAIELGIEHFIIKPIIFDKIDKILYDLAFKLEQEKLLQENERLTQRQQIEHAFNTSLTSLVNNIPLPSLVVDQDDKILIGNSEMISIITATKHYKSFLNKELTFKDIISAESLSKATSLICDWKEEALLTDESLLFKIEDILYRIKIKRILSENNTRFYILCLIENEND